MKTNIVCLLGGIAAVAAIKMISSTPKAREFCVKTLAKGIKASDRVKSAFHGLKVDAEGLCAEAEAQAQGDMR